MAVQATTAVKFLVACSACRRQFEAGGLAPGSLFRCSCGETVRVPRARAHDADVVRCSSCSAPRRHGAGACDHCGADFTLRERDLHTICPACMTRISDRARFCHGCGTPIVPQGKAGEPTQTACPCCSGEDKLHSRRLGKAGMTVLECPRCAGLWLGHRTFKLITEKARSGAAGADAFAAGSTGGVDRRKTTRGKGPMYRRCPECGQMMHRRNFGKRSGVIIDACKHHGYWFDAEELEAILKWIREGGEARSRSRDEADRAHRARTGRYMTDRLERMAGSSSGANPFGGGFRDDRHSSLGGFFSALFDL